MVGGCPWRPDRNEAAGEFGDVRVAQARLGADSNVTLSGVTFHLIWHLIHISLFVFQTFWCI